MERRHGLAATRKASEEREDDKISASLQIQKSPPAAVISLTFDNQTAGRAVGTSFPQSTSKRHQQSKAAFSSSSARSNHLIHNHRPPNAQADKFSLPQSRQAFTSSSSFASSSSSVSASPSYSSKGYGVGFASKSQRFGKPRYRTPSPGQYQIHYTTSGTNKPTSQPVRAATPSVIIDYHTAPSIPIQKPVLIPSSSYPDTSRTLSSSHDAHKFAQAERQPPFAYRTVTPSPADYHPHVDPIRPRTASSSLAAFRSNTERGLNPAYQLYEAWPPPLLSSQTQTEKDATKENHHDNHPDDPVTVSSMFHPSEIPHDRSGQVLTATACQQRSLSPSPADYRPSTAFDSRHPIHPAYSFPNSDSFRHTVHCNSLPGVGEYNIEPDPRLSRSYHVNRHQVWL